MRQKSERPSVDAHFHLAAIHPGLRRYVVVEHELGIRRSRRNQNRGTCDRKIPRIILLADDIPAIHRHAPVLARGTEGVGRHAERDVEMKLLLARPHVCAVAVNHERKIAEQLDAVRAVARNPPL